MTNKKPIEVLYIVGSGHSGSTILNLILGSSNNAFSTSELIFLNERFQNLRKDGSPLPENERYCTCGSLLTNCKFWSPIFENIESESLFKYVRSPMLRYIQAVKSIFTFSQIENSEDLKLMQLIAQNSREEYSLKQSCCIIDSSKNLNRLLFLKAHKGLNVRVIHLIRSAEGHINSIEKRGNNWITGSILWLFNNLLIKFALKLRVPRRDRLKLYYEDIFNDIRDVIEVCNLKFGLSMCTDSAKLIDSINSSQSHLVAGNSGAKKKIDSFSIDTKWKYELAPHKIILARFLNLLI